MRTQTILKCIVLLAVFATMGCNNKNNRDNRDKVDKDKDRDDKVNVDQKITQRFFPTDSIFIDFQRTWPKFISKSVDLIKPVVARQQQDWRPVIISDCVMSNSAGKVVPEIEISWSEPVVQEKIVRFDIALQSQAFERNYYTTAYPVEVQQRFVIPGISAYVTDTAAMMLTGPALLPKVTQYSQIAIADQQQPSIEGGRTQMLRKTLKIQELGFGLSYKIRMCSFNREVWLPTQEIIFTTPICPVDYK